MAEEEKPRAVSGEIMAGGAEASVRPRRDGDFIDADYISVPAAPSGAGASAFPATGGAAMPPPVLVDVPPAAGMEMLRLLEPSPAAPARGGPVFWIVGVALVLAAFWVSGGHALVQGLAHVGGDAAQGALRISAVTSRVDASGKRAILFVDGEAANDGAALAHLPPLEIAVTGNDGLVTRYRLGTSGRPMAPGETFAFSSRLDAPKNGVKTVTVTFAQ